MDWQEKNVLVTGAGGFIASHLVEKLVSLGAKVGAFVRYNSRSDWGMIDLLPLSVKERVRVYSGDLRDFQGVREAMKDKEIVFHLASLIAIPYSYLHPSEVVENNIVGTLNVLNAAREVKPERIVHTSTSEVYGTAQYVPIDEQHPLRAQSPYSASKIGADKLVESFYCSYNLPVVTVRPFNTYGPRQSPRAVIPTVILQALLGKEVRLGSLWPTRDFTYVEDIVNGFVKAAEADNCEGEVVNLGSCSEISVKELAEKIISLVGRKVKIVCEEKRKRPPKSEVERLVADNSKARKLLGWSPSVPLEEGLKITIEWFSDHKEFYRLGNYYI